MVEHNFATVGCKWLQKNHRRPFMLSGRVDDTISF